MAGTTYTIDFADPSLPNKTSFEISPGNFDGPSHSTNKHTSLNLFGQGYLRYGEKANENFLRLLENFASSVEPEYPTIGQTWFDANTNTLKVYDINGAWSAAGGVLPPQQFVIISASAGTNSFVISGDVTSQLTPGSQFVVTGTGTANDGQVFTVASTPAVPSFDGTNTLVYVAEPVVTHGVGGTAYYTEEPPLSTRSIGQLWYDVTEEALKMWDGTNWVRIYGTPTDPTDNVTKEYVDERVLRSGDTMTGTLTMSGAGVHVVLPNTPTVPTHAANKAYVDSAVGSGTSGYLPLTGGTLTGNVVMSGGTTLQLTNSGVGGLILNVGGGSVNIGPDIQINQQGLITADSNLYLHVDADNDGVGSFVIAKGSYTRSGTEVNLLTIYNDGEVRSNISNYETLVTHDDTLTNKKYVDNAISSAVGGATSIPAINPTTPKDGDIRIVGSVISIRAAGAWRQVYPAVYA